MLPEGTELSPRPDWVPAWTSLSADERRLYARFMEAFAGFLSHTDHEIGRFVDYLRHTGDLDNTLLFVLSDNGASSEGGPTGSLNDVRPWNGVHHDPGGGVGAHRRDRRAPLAQQLPLGLDGGRQHARSAAGSARCTRVGWPTR